MIQVDQLEESTSATCSVDRSILSEMVAEQSTAVLIGPIWMRSKASNVPRMSRRSDLVTRMVAGTNICRKRNQALYIKERIYVAQANDYTCYRLFVDGSRLIRNGRTEGF